jgi:hypothetical protein
MVHARPRGRSRSGQGRDGSGRAITFTGDGQRAASGVAASMPAMPPSSVFMLVSTTKASLLPVATLVPA